MFGDENDINQLGIHNNKSLINTKKTCNIGSFNVRSKLISFTSFRLYELVLFCIKSKLDILAIQEHRNYFSTSNNEDKIRRKQISKGWWFIYSSASEKSIGGVGFIISKKAFENLSEITYISDRILKISLGNNNFICNIFSIYSPTSEHDELSIKSFYNNLSDSLYDIPREYANYYG